MKLLSLVLLITTSSCLVAMDPSSIGLNSCGFGGVTTQTALAVKAAVGVVTPVTAASILPGGCTIGVGTAIGAAILATPGVVPAIGIGAIGYSSYKAFKYFTNTKKN